MVEQCLYHMFLSDGGQGGGLDNTILSYHGQICELPC